MRFGFAGEDPSQQYIIYISIIINAVYNVLHALRSIYNIYYYYIHTSRQVRREECEIFVYDRGKRTFRGPSSLALPRASVSVNDGTSLGADRRMCSRRSLPARVHVFAGGGLDILHHMRKTHILLLLYNIRNRNNILCGLRHYLPSIGTGRSSSLDRGVSSTFFFSNFLSRLTALHLGPTSRDFFSPFEECPVAKNTNCCILNQNRPFLP